MNRTADDTTSLSCGFAFLPLNPSQISPDLYAVIIMKFAVTALTCPIIILLNILVMVAVKTKRQLRTKSNIALACLATTDLVVGLVVQPLQIASSIFLFHGETNVFCSLKKIAMGFTFKCILLSLYHLLLMSAERYVAAKHSFKYESLVTEARFIKASGLAWATVIVLTTQDLWLTNRYLIIFAVFVTLFLFFPAIIYFNVVVYKEARSSDKKIAANQVSLEAREKILKNKKTFYTTVIVLLFIFLCYIPTILCTFIVFYFKDSISTNVGHIAMHIFSLLPLLNSLFNPLIYTVRIRYFRVAFIQLLSRKTLAQAEELEWRTFGPRQTGVIVIANVEQGQNRESREEDEQQGNETLNSGHATAVRSLPQEG